MIIDTICLLDTRAKDSLDNTPNRPTGVTSEIRPRAPLPQKPVTSEVAIVVTSPTQAVAPLPPSAQGDAIGIEPTAKTTG